jgi:hypothetical protein
MKTKIFVLIPFLFCSYVLSAEILSFSLFEALQKKMVKVDIKGIGITSDNSNGHYGKCFECLKVDVRCNRAYYICLVVLCSKFIFWIEDLLLSLRKL